jgi:hypothetical protein
MEARRVLLGDGPKKMIIEGTEQQRLPVSSPSPDPFDDLTYYYSAAIPSPYSLGTWPGFQFPIPNLFVHLHG